MAKERGALAESVPPATQPVPLPSRLRRAGRASPVTEIESDGVCRVSSADTALQKLEIHTVFLRFRALSRRKILRHPQNDQRKRMVSRKQGGTVE